MKFPKSNAESLEPRIDSISRLMQSSIGAAASKVTDADLLDQFVRNRDQQAFELLLWRYSKLVRHVSYDILGDFHHVEDAAQAVFLALALKADSLRNRDALGAWLHRVTVNISLRLRRRLPPPSSVSVEWDEVTDRNQTNRPDHGVIIHELIARLPEKYRRIMFLCYFEGLTYSEAAARLNISLGTLMSRSHRARAMIKRWLDQRGVSAALGLPAVFVYSSSQGFSIEFAASTALAALRLSVGESAGSGAREISVCLARAAIREMGWMKAKTTLALGILTVLAGGSLTVAAAGIVGTDHFTQPVLTPIVEKEHRDLELEKLGAIRGEFVDYDRATIMEGRVARFETEDIGKSMFSEFIAGSGVHGQPGYALTKNCFDAAGNLKRIPKLDVPFGLSFGPNDAKAKSVIASLADCPNLTTLDIASELDAEEIAGLAKLKFLKQLRVSIRDVEKHESLKKLAECVQLTRLTLIIDNDRPEVKTQYVGLKELAKIQGLTHLDLLTISGPIDNEELKELTEFKELRHLSLGCEKLTDGIDNIGLESIASLNTITNFAVRSSRITGEGIADLANRSKLKYLRVCTNQFKMETLNLWKNSPLEYLDLYAFQLSLMKGVELEEKAVINVKYLILSSPTPDPDGIEGIFKNLARFKSLRHLGLRFDEFPANGFKEIAKLTKLRGLMIQSSSLSENGLNDLSEMNLNQLRVNRIRNSTLTPEQDQSQVTGMMNSLEKFKRLRVLDLSGSATPPKLIEMLQRKLPDCEIVR